MSRNGHSTSGCALVTDCGSLCVAPEKKLAILSFKDGVLGVAGAVGAPADPAAGGAAVDAVVAGTPPPPLTTASTAARSEEHTSELQSLTNLVCRLLLETKNNT